MGVHDRTYWKEESPRSSGGWGGWGGGPGGLSRLPRIGLPKPSRAVLGLIIACLIVFVAYLSEWWVVVSHVWMTLRPGFAHEVWRFLTFQFLHGGADHVMFNMLGLYFFGPSLERLWGTRRFLVFYLACGTFAGVCFLLMCLLLGITGPFLLGASGGVLACVMACAILFPDFIVLIFPIRWVAAFYAGFYILSAVVDKNLADAAHLGGMVAAAVWILLIPRLRGAGDVARAGREKINQGAWRRKQRRREEEDTQIDRILQKIKDHGIGSLTRGEKKALQDATRRERDQDRRINRM